MNIHPEGGIHPHLSNYTPTGLTAKQWKGFACPVCALVTRADPRNEEDAGHLASALCGLLSSRLALRAEANGGEVFTSQTIERHTIGLEIRHGAIVASTAYARLQRLLNANQGLQPLEEQRRERAFGTALDERAIQELRSRINESPPEVGAVLGRCLLFGLASGFQGRDASKASVAIAAKGELEIEHLGRLRHVLDRFIPELRKMWELDQICKNMDFEIAATADLMTLPFEERFTRKIVFHVQGELDLNLDDVLGFQFVS